MKGFDELYQKAGRIAEVILNGIRDRKNTVIVSHLDADGITSASIIARAISRRKGRYLIRITSDLNRNFLQSLKEAQYDFHILCDLGAGMANELDDILGENWVGLDHHQIPPQEKPLECVLNAWQFDIDGGVEICSGGMAYIVSRNMDEANRNLAWMAVISALADRQDQGEKHSLAGLNKQIVEDAVQDGAVKVDTSLLLYGRDSKPIHEAIADSSTPYIPGLTGNRARCLALLSSTGLTLKEDGAWRTISSLSDEEIKSVIETIIPHIDPNLETTEKIEQLVGTIYILENEDERSSLRDAREFATLLNACGRTANSGIGVKILFGDRGKSLSEGQGVLREYRQKLNLCIQSILGDASRVVNGKQMAVISGNSLVKEEMVGAVASILGGISRFEGKIILIGTTTETDEVKFSLRLGRLIGTSMNLGRIAAETARLCDGVGGGHKAAAGARIPVTQMENFIQLVSKRLEEAR